MNKIKREQELVAEKAWNTFHPGDYSMVKVLDKVCPGWGDAEFEYINIDDGTDVLYRVGDVWIRGWDVTGAINARMRKVRTPRRRR